MQVTNLTVLAVKLKKLLGVDCTANLLSERAIAVHFNEDSDVRSGTIEGDVDGNGVCNVNMTVRYAIQQSEIAAVAAKLRGEDTISVHVNSVNVRRKYVMKIDNFEDLSIEQVEHAAEDIFGTMKSL